MSKIEPLKISVPKISSRDTRPHRAHSPVAKQLEQSDTMLTGPGAKREPNKQYVKLKSVELEDAIKRAKKYAMEQSVRFVLVKQQQHQQKQQLDLIKKQQALLLMCRIYVGSIFYEVREEIVRTQFSHFGPIRSISMSWDAATNKHKGFAFIEFETPEAAQLALEQMNGALLGGRNIKVGRPSNMPQAQPIIDQLTEEAKSYNRIYVASIHSELSEQDVQSVFEAFGAIKSCGLIRDPATGKHKGYGFIEYETLQSAHDAIASMNSFDLGGQLLRVGKAVTPPDNQLLNPAASLLSATSTTTPTATTTTTTTTTSTATTSITTSVQDSKTPTQVTTTPTTAPLAQITKTIVQNSPTQTATNTSVSSSTSTTTSTTATSSTTQQSTPQAATPQQQTITSLLNGSNLQPVDISNMRSIELTENQKQLLGMTSIDDPSASLDQQVEMTLKSKEQRLLLMRKLMQRKPESTILILRNMVGPEDLDDELETEITDECGKFGEVERVLIYQEKQGEEEDAEIIVKIFVEFQAGRSVELAVEALNGRFFAGRVVKAEPYDQAAYFAKDYSG